MKGFVTQAVGSKMHRDENLGFQIFKGSERFFRIHVVFPKFGAVIGPDGKKGDFGV